MPIVSVDLKMGQAVKVQNNRVINPFIAVGKIMNNKGFDFADVMSKLAPAAHKVFWEMVKLRDDMTNLVYIDSKNLTASQNSIISKNYRLLAEADLLLKVGKGTYFINPYAVLPVLDRCELVNLEWNKQYAEHKNKKG